MTANTMNRHDSSVCPYFLAADKGGDELTMQGIEGKEGKQGVETEAHTEVKALALTLRSGQRRIERGKSLLRCLGCKLKTVSPCAWTKSRRLESFRSLSFSRRSRRRLAHTCAFLQSKACSLST